MRRIYYKEISDGNIVSLNSVTTEANSNSSPNLNVKDENNLSEKHELPKTKTTPKKNLETRFTTKKHESPNYTLRNITLDKNKNIKLKQDPRLSYYCFEEPENLIDVAYQNKLIDDFKNTINYFNFILLFKLFFKYEMRTNYY